MSVNSVDQEANLPLTPEVAEEIVRLGEIQVNNPMSQTRENHPLVPLFGQRQAINTRQLWGVLLYENHEVSREQLNEIGQFFRDPETEEGVRNVHRQLTAGDEKHLTGGIWFTGFILYPLIKDLVSTPSSSFRETFSSWRNDWSQGIDPEKFRMAFTILFRLLAHAPKETQEWYIPNIGDQPLQESEAEFLTGIFEQVYVGINDVDKIAEADRRGRKLSEPVFSADDIYHTTDLSTLPQIITKGLLATECTSLTQDGFREASFAVSFHNFKEPPTTLADLGEQLKKERGLLRAFDHKIHLAFLNPKKAVDPGFILYPPESFWFNRATRKNNVAGRYIGGFDSDGSDFGNQTIAYVLIGMPSTSTTFVMLDDNDKEEYAKVARGLPFYIPAYSYEGTLIYTSEQYDKEKPNAN